MREMKLQDLKSKTPTELLTFAEELRRREHELRDPREHHALREARDLRVLEIVELVLRGASHQPPRV